jgi:hypothetical protein
MPLINNSTTLLKIMKIKDGEMFNDVLIDSHEKGIIYAKIIAQVIRLFMLGVVHLDLHSKNVLIYTKNKTIKTLLIDFGSASEIFELKQDNIYKKGDKQRIDFKIEKITERFKLMSDVSDDEKIDFISGTLDEIILLDKNHTAKLNGYYSDSEYHLAWCEEMFEGLSLEYNVVSFDILKEIFNLPDQMIMSYKAFEEYEREGHFINFKNKKNDDFFVTFNHIPQHSPNHSPKHNVTCVLSGGKRKSKTKRKRKLIKKIKL